MSSNERARCSSFRSANRPAVDLFRRDRERQLRRGLRHHRGAVERPLRVRGFGAGRGGGFEDRFAQLVRRVVGGHLELAAVFEEFREAGRK